MSHDTTDNWKSCTTVSPFGECDLNVVQDGEPDAPPVVVGPRAGRVDGVVGLGGADARTQLPTHPRRPQRARQITEPPTRVRHRSSGARRRRGFGQPWHQPVLRSRAFDWRLCRNRARRAATRRGSRSHGDRYRAEPRGHHPARTSEPACAAPDTGTAPVAVAVRGHDPQTAARRRVLPRGRHSTRCHREHPRHDPPCLRRHRTRLARIHSPAQCP